jgi:hypothetical protein
VSGIAIHRNGHLKALAAEVAEPPPHNIEAEQGVLGAMLGDNVVIADVRRSGLRPKHFYSDAHARVFRAVCAVHDRGVAVDSVSVFEQLRAWGDLGNVGGPSYLAVLWDAVPTSANWNYHVSIVRDYWVRREAIRRARVLIRDAHDGYEPGAGLVAEHVRGLSDLADDPLSVSRWPAVKSASEVGRDAPDLDYVWSGVIALRHITLLSALMKCGKSTLLAFLLRSLERGDNFLGMRTRPANVLYVTEESEVIWKGRINEVGIADHVRFVNQPFVGRPSHADWVSFLDHLHSHHTKSPFDMIVFDTVSNLWPVANENDAAEVITALMPLRRLTAAGPAVLAVHHLGKASLGEGKGARGSTGLGGFVDVMVELKRYDPAKQADRRRVLTSWGRFPDVPADLVICLAEDGRSYAAEGDRREAHTRDAREVLLSILPRTGEGWTWEEIEKNWPAGHGWNKATITTALKSGLDRDFLQTGRGRKGDPHRYHRA